MRVLFFLLLMFVFFPVWLAAQTLPLNLSLSEAQKLALKYNPDLQQLRVRLYEQDGVIQERRSTGLPKLGVTGDYTVYDRNILQSFGSSNSVDDTSWGALVEASTPIFSGGRSRLAVKSAKATLQSLEAQIVSQEQDLLIHIQEVYHNVLLEKIAVKVQKEAIAVYDEQLKITRNRFKSGVGAKFDVLQAEVSLANAQPPLIYAENNVLRYTDRLRRLIGLPLPKEKKIEDIKLKDISPVEKYPMQLEEALETAIKNRSEIHGIDQEIEAQEKLLTYEKRQNWPLITIFGNYGRRSNQYGHDDLEGWTAGGRLSWNIISGGKFNARVHQAQARIEQLEYEKKALLLSIEGEVREAFYDYREAESILNSSTQVIKQAEEALRLSKNRYKAGKGTQLEILESQLQLTRSRMDVSIATHNLQLSIFRIIRSIGEPIGLKF